MNYRQPFTGTYPISQKFGEKYTDSRGHTGIDYACPAGTPVLASNDGLVFFTGWKEGGYGYCVFIKHNDGNVSIYEHLLKDIPVTTGQHVTKGTVIGYSGSTGNSTGPHLHFELRDSDGKAFDPMLVLQTASDAGKFEKPEKTKLKEADELPELVRVVAPAGARRFNEDWSFPYPSSFNYGTKLRFTGRTAKRPGNYPYTYCEVYEEPKKFWVAVHDEDTQILDK